MPNETLKPRDECLYYLVREMGGLGVKAKDIYFDNMLEHVRKDGFKNICKLEVKAVIMAAEQRGRLQELDEAVEMGCNE